MDKEEKTVYEKKYDLVMGQPHKPGIIERFSIWYLNRKLKKYYE